MTINVTDLLSYYKSLLIIQYRGKPKAEGLIEAFTKPMMADGIFDDVEYIFDITTAEGVQLDTLGKYAGVSRNQQNFSGPITLDDDDYRKLIQIRIIQNNYNSDLGTIVDLLYRYFGQNIKVTDNQDMTLTYIFDTNFGKTNLAEVFITGGYLPRPMGVGLQTAVIPSKYFGMRTYTADNGSSGPFNTYDSYDSTSSIWINYDVIF